MNAEGHSQRYEIGDCEGPSVTEPWERNPNGRYDSHCHAHVNSHMEEKKARNADDQENTDPVTSTFGNAYETYKNQ